MQCAVCSHFLACCLSIVALSPLSGFQVEAAGIAPADNRPDKLISLADSLDPLVDQFNKDAARYRLVALLSPT